jgi:hypothetical protein
MYKTWPRLSAASAQRRPGQLRDLAQDAKGMVLATFLVLSGLALCGYGVVLAGKARRPIDLLGAVLAAAGLATAMLGAGRLLSDHFFSG